MPPFFSNGQANKRRAGPSCDGSRSESLDSGNLPKSHSSRPGCEARLHRDSSPPAIGPGPGLARSIANPLTFRVPIQNVELKVNGGLRFQVDLSIIRETKSLYYQRDQVGLSISWSLSLCQCQCNHRAGAKQLTPQKITFPSDSSRKIAFWLCSYQDQSPFAAARVEA